MGLNIYDSLTRKILPFHSVNEGKVNMYVCGPTVYDQMHIGNARPLIFFDIVRRYLEFIGYEVNYIVNFTDVDDKLIYKANEQHLSVSKLADKFIHSFEEDREKLGVLPPTVAPRVTENMDQIIAFIQKLVASNHAYEAEGDVFFCTSSFPSYGKLSHKRLADLKHGIRIEVDARKKTPHDFVLWKAVKSGEVKWSSPWGEGRPGWHIECSTLIQKFAGKTLDIHAGGIDLQFPHHECEIAQSECLSNQPLARYWMHNGYVQVDNEKMSKSLGNAINVREMLKKTSPFAVRYLILSVHYRSPLNLSQEMLTQATNSVERLLNSRINIAHRLALCSSKEDDFEFQTKLKACVTRFFSHLDNDFNTSDAITAWYELVSLGNGYLQRDCVNEPILSYMLETIEQFNEILGLLPTISNSSSLDEEVEELIAERIQARQAKKFSRADEIRVLLAKQGIILEDTPQGVRWHRK